MKSRRFSVLLSLLTLASPLLAYDQVTARPALLLADKKADPTILRLDATGAPWILNPKLGAVQKISDHGTVAVHIAGKKGPFKEPVDFVFLKDNTLAVADAGARKIVFIKGTTSSKNAAWKKAKVESDFPVGKVTAIAVSADDIVAVGSSAERAVDFYSRTGVPLFQVSLPEKEAFGAVTALAFSANGTLWVLDGSKGRLHRFSAERKWLGATDGLDGARGLTVDRAGFAYVTLSKGKWVEIDPSGANTGTFGAQGRAPGQLLEPIGIAADDRGVLVAEAGNRRLQGFDVINNQKAHPVLPGPAAFIQVRIDGTRDGGAEKALFLSDGAELVLRPKGMIEKLSAKGAVDGAWKKKEKKEPGVAELGGWVLDDAGKIWVSDSGEHVVKAVSADGAVLATIGKKGKKEGSLKSPTSLAVRPDGSIVVADRGGSRIQVLSKDGLFLFSVGSSGKKEGQYAQASAVAANKDVIAVLDASAKQLLFYSSTGKFMSAIANKEDKLANWKDPVDLASDPQGRFFVLDAGARRVRCFNAKGAFLADFTATGKGIACGPDGRVALLDDKAQTLYDVHFVPRASAKVAAADAEGDIKVTWEPVGEASAYRVYRSTGDGVFVAVGSATATSFTDTNVVPASQYVYAVAGVGAGGHEGVWAAADPMKASRRKDVSLVSIESVSLKPIFTAAFKYYVKTPIGEVTVRNNDDKPYRNVKISISLARYTDFPTVTLIPSLGAGEKVSVPVTLTLNEKVLELTENTPVQAEVRASYYEDNAERVTSQNAPVTLYSRNAISWTDKARLASFVTPRDTPVVEFSRAAVRAFLKDLKASTVTKPLAKAALLYESVNALNISYVPDPNTPFSEVSGKPEALDYTQFPRETMRRKTGDCDDTTALMCALLESIGVQTAVVDMPGHVLMMANLEESDPEVIGLPEERFVFFNGTYWVPIETTQLGHSFLDAWQTASGEIKAAQAKGTVSFLAMSEAEKTYEPVTLVEPDPNAPAFPEAKVKETFPPILAKLQKERFDDKLLDINTRLKSDPNNPDLKLELAMIQVEGGHPEAAKPILEGLTAPTESDETRAAAENNLGNISYLAGEYKSAAAYYDAAGKLSPQDGGILVNRARAAWKLGDEANAKTLIAQGAKDLPDWREYVGDLPQELVPK